MIPIAAIIGRPNVGKSTLFNRLINDRKAIIDDASGITRDRHYAKAEWGGKEFNLIDTGGYVPGSEDIFESAIREQVNIAMEEADVLLFVVDVNEGVNPMERDFADVVRRSKKPVFLVANKSDNSDRRTLALEFYELGIGDPYPVSALSGSGTGDLLDAVVKSFPPKKEVADDYVEENPTPKFAIVGRPNVGKSSLVNSLLGKERTIVTNIAGTTRDSIHTHFNAFGHDLILIDTAGLRKKAKVKENVEFYSTIRSIRAIEECDVAILVLDATQGMEQQDLDILAEMEQAKKGMLILVNKWDLVEKDTKTAEAYTKLILERIEPLSGVPILFISATERQRILKVLELAMQVYHEKQKRIPTHELNEVMMAVVAAHHPPSDRGRIIRIKYVTQIKAPAPTFLFFCNHPKLVAENYRRYLENQIREHFGFKGVPVNVYFRDK